MSTKSSPPRGRFLIGHLVRDPFLHGAAALLLTGLTVSCKSEEPAPKPAEAPAVAQVAPPPAAKPETPPPEDKPKADARPKNIDTKLTDARRTAIETAVPTAKGFLVASEIEEKLKADKKVSAEDAAVKAFDRAAKGKWVLFTGTAVNVSETGFDMAIVYTPLIKGDVMGMSRQFFTVTFSNVEGYTEGKLKAGQTAVVLAEYNGKKKASPAHELVALGKWE